MECEEEVQVKDEMGIFVKEEEIFTAAHGAFAYDEDASIDIAELLVQPHPQCLEFEVPQRKLLVYTTKLDDMKCWYTIKDPNRVLDAIITESKPALPKSFKNKKKRKNVAQFKKLLTCLQRYKEKRLEVTHRPTRHIVAIHNFRLPSEVYFLERSGIPTGFYRTNEFVGTSNYRITREDRKSCCWFKRNKIWKYIELEDCSTTWFKFMRIPHGCDVGNCECCCRRKYNYVSQFAIPKTIQRTAKSHVKNRWQQRLLYRREQQKTNSLINAALVHKRGIKTPNKTEKNKEYYRSSCLKLICNNKLTHSYYIGDNGLISTYIRPNTFPTVQYVNDMISSCISSVESTNICCLTEYKKYCLTLTKLAHPTVVKFLINTSINGPNKCDSCENIALHHDGSSKLATITSVFTYLPKYPKHNKPFSKFNAMRGANILQKERYMEPNTILNTVIDNTDCNSMKSSLPDTSQNIPGEPNTQTCIVSKLNKNVDPNFINLGIEDLRLTIYPGGKVKILTKTPADKISTENLTVLREIIKHAQDKVLSKKFSPVRSIDVNNVFTNNHEKQPESKGASSNILWTVLNSTKKTQHHQLNASKNNQGNNVITKIRNSLQKSKKNVSANSDSNLTKQDNFYEALTKISAEKRKRYSISHEFLKNEEINLWATVDELRHEKVVEDVTINPKRKTADKGTSPPPKQQRKESLGNTICVAPMTSTKTPFISIIPPNIYTESLQQPQTATFLPTATNVSMQAIPTESLKVTNPSFSLQDNVRMIPIGQLPQELVASLYKKYAFLPENTQLRNVQAQNLNPINVTEQLLPTISLLDETDVPLHDSDVKSIPVVQKTQEENIDDADPKEDDCILGV